MSTTGESQSLPPKLEYLELAGLLRLKAAGEPFPCSRYIHEASPYSADPEDLVRGRDPAPGTGVKGMAWYFYSPVHAGGAARRNRQVGGGGERRFWHPEGGEKPILGQDGKPVGWAYWRTLSYVLKVKNPPPAAAKSFRNERLGWCMVEIGLRQQHGGGGQQWEICKVYRSPLPRSTAAVGEDVCPDARTGSTSGVADSANRRGMSGGDNTCPSPTPPPAASSRDDQSILTSIELKPNITMLNIKSTRMLGQPRFLAKSISIFENQDIYIHRMATSEDNISVIIVPSELLSRELVKRELDIVVEQLRKFAVVDRLEDKSAITLVGNSSMSPLIFEKAFCALRSTGVQIHMISQVSAEVTHVSSVVPASVAEYCEQALRAAIFSENGFVSDVHGAENERPTPENSYAAASSSGIKKRKNHQSPPGASQVLADSPDPSAAVVGCTGIKKRKNHQSPPGASQVLADSPDPSAAVVGCTAFPGNDPIMPAGCGDVEDLEEYFRGIFEENQVEAQQGVGCSSVVAVGLDYQETGDTDFIAPGKMADNDPIHMVNVNCSGLIEPNFGDIAPSGSRPCRGRSRMGVGLIEPNFGDSALSRPCGGRRRMGVRKSIWSILFGCCTSK